MAGSRRRRAPARGRGPRRDRRHIVAAGGQGDASLCPAPSRLRAHLRPGGRSGRQLTLARRGQGLRVAPSCRLAAAVGLAAGLAAIRPSACARAGARVRLAYRPTLSSSGGRPQAGVLQRQPRVPFGRPFGPMTAGLHRRAGGLLGPVLRGARGEWLALAIFVVLANAAGWLSRPGSFVPDIKPEVYLAPWRSAVDYLAAWRDDPFLGSASFDVGLGPVAFVVACLDVLGAPPEVAVRLFRVALLVVGTLGARQFV